jgi:hypothetical protein
MLATGRCPCSGSPAACLSCKDQATNIAGVRPAVQPDASCPAYVPDLVRDRAAGYLGGGYLRQGYDSGRVF